jgi:peptidoglycan/LPS O-acetylase OafA/YrhL
MQARHVPGYPNRGQIEFYVVFPLLIAAIALVLSILLRRTRWSGRGTTALIAALLLLIPYGFVFIGGM